MSNVKMQRTRRGLRRGLAGLAALTVVGASLLMASPAQAAVTGVKASVLGTDVIRLTWSKVTGAGSYQVQWSTSSKFTGATTKKVTDPLEVTNAFTSATGLSYGKTYYLRVRACADASAACSTVVQTWSSKVSGKTKYIYNTKPTNLVANNISSSSVELSFTNVSGAPGYRIRFYNRIDKAQYVWSQVEELTLEGLTDEHGNKIGLRKNTEYWISASVQQPPLNPGTKDYVPLVRMGPESKELKIKTSNYDIPAPTGVRISDQSHDSVVVSWVAPPEFADSGRMGPMSAEEIEPEPLETVEPTPEPTDTSTPAPTTPAPTTPTEEPSAAPPSSPAPGPSEEPTDVEQLTGLRPSALPEGYRYRVQYALNKNMSGAKSAYTTDTSITLTGLNENTNYYVRVDLVDAAGKALSDKSAYQIAKTRVKGGNLTGQVTGLSGSQWRDVVVSVYGTGGEMVKQVDIKSNGSYSARVRPGSYRVKISYLGTAGLTSAWAAAGAAEGQQTLAEGTVYSFSAAGAQVPVANVKLVKGASLTGTVQNKSGAKLSGVDVAVLTAQTSAREIVSVQQTPSGGSFTLNGLGEGYHWVRFIRSGYKNLSVRILVENQGGSLKVTERMISDVTAPVSGGTLGTLTMNT